jgi:hypothetical protein
VYPRDDRVYTRIFHGAIIDKFSEKNEGDGKKSGGKRAKSRQSRAKKKAALVQGAAKDTDLS